MSDELQNLAIDLITIGIYNIKIIINFIGSQSAPTKSVVNYFKMTISS